MSASPLLLGLDIGTSRMKAVLLGRDGREHGSFAGPTPFSPDDGGIDMPVEAFVGALGQVLGGLGDARQRVAAVGVAGVAESGAPLDEAGRAVGPVIAWHDPRGEEAVQRLTHELGDQLAARIGQPLRTVSSIAKLGWLRDQGMTGVRRWLGLPELVVFHLTGAQATDHSLAARTGVYDVVERSYMPEVTGALGLDPDVFAPVSVAGSPMGEVSRTGSAWSGLPRGVPVTIAGHDHLAGAEGVGAGGEDLVNSVGTAETVMRRTADPPDMDQALRLRAAVTLRPGGGEWVVLASAARAGLVLDAVAEALGRPLEELDDSTEGAGRAEVTDDMVRAIQGGEPPELPEAPIGDVWNGVLFALCQRTFESVGRLVELLGPARRLIVFGGGSRSRPWMRAKAEVGDLPVVRTREPEAVVRGAASFAGVAAGWWPSAEEAPTPPLDEVG